MEKSDSLIIDDEVVDKLMEDWLERDGETFVKKRTTGRLGWEKTVEGDSYSAYILKSPTKSDLIRYAYTLAKETVISMDTPFKVSVKVSPGPASYTDSKILCVSTKVFDESELSNGEKLDTFLGYVVHEGAHLLYTDFKEYGKISHGAIVQLCNLIEDERIERVLGYNKPGLVNFIEKVKYYLFDQYYLDYVIPEKGKRELNPFEEFFNLFLSIIRYPKYLEETDIIKFAKYLIKVKEVVTPYPESTNDSVRCAYKVFDIIKELYKDIEREKSSDSSSESSPTGSPTEKEISERAEKSLTEDMAKGYEKRKIVCGSSKTVPDKESKDSELSKSEISDSLLSDEGLLGELCEGKAEIGIGKDTFFFKALDEKTKYLDSYGRIRQYIPAIQKVLKGHCKEYKLIHRSMRSGVLDTNKLAEAFQGVQTCYMREGEVKTDKVSVVVLVDESGSMAGSRIVAAKDAAILINEAVGKIPNVELFIYGHSGDMKRELSTEMFVYREKGYAPKYSLGSIYARSQNRDGVAIYETATRVRKQTKNHCLFFILSDGAPCAGAYGGSSAMEHVRREVKKVENMDFTVVQVCINHSYDPGKMFKNFVILEDMGNLAIELSKTIKKSTMSASKVHIS